MGTLGNDDAVLKALVRRRLDLGVDVSVIAERLGVTDEVVARMESGELPMTDADDSAYREAIYFRIPVFKYSTEQLNEIEQLVRPFGKPVPSLELMLAVKFAFHRSNAEYKKYFEESIQENNALITAIEKIERQTYDRIGNVIDLGEGVFEADEVGEIAERLKPLLEQLKSITSHNSENAGFGLRCAEDYLTKHKRPGPATKVRENRFTDRVIALWLKISGSDGPTAGLDKAHNQFFTAVVEPVFSFKPYRDSFGTSWTDNKFRTSVARWNAEHGHS